ncbi:hypothetical protein HZS_161 [Henneguya salminicola]|nr:hypothetical protein HZS_161 [Henneguya salminicola]
MNLITGLLEANPKRRLGASSDGIEEIKNSEFFNDLSWEDLYEKKLTEEDNKFYLDFNSIHYDLWRKEISDIQNDKDLKYYGFVYQFMSKIFSRWKKKIVLIYESGISITDKNLNKKLSFTFLSIANIELISLKSYICLRLNISEKKLVLRGLTKEEIEWLYLIIKKLKMAHLRKNIEFEEELPKKYISHENIQDINQNSILLRTNNNIVNRMIVSSIVLCEHKHFVGAKKDYINIKYTSLTEYGIRVTVVGVTLLTLLAAIFCKLADTNTNPLVSVLIRSNFKNRKWI